jgi:hypothetical protein
MILLLSFYLTNNAKFFERNVALPCFNFLIRLKLGYEEKSVGLNRAKITDQWRNILRKAKTVDLRRDVVTLKVTTLK